MVKPSSTSPEPGPAIGASVRFTDYDGSTLHAVVSHVQHDGTVLLAVLGRRGNWSSYGPASRGPAPGQWMEP